MDTAGSILLADDEETFLHSTADLIRREGYVVDCVMDGAAAAARLDEKSYDLLIADIKMPGNAEMELVRDVARRSTGFSVILVTGFPSVGSAVSSIDLPVAAYLVKPFDFDVLLGHIHGCVARRRVLQSVQQMRLRLLSWQRDLESSASMMEAERKVSGAAALQPLVDVTLGNTFRCLTELRQLMGALNDRSDAVDPPSDEIYTRADGIASKSSAKADVDRMRLVLERLANDLEELGIVTRGFGAPANLELQKSLSNLSRREWEILRQLRAHYRVGTIARSLHLSPHTVRNHLKSVFRKVGVHSQEELLNVLEQPERLGSRSEATPRRQ